MKGCSHFAPLLDELVDGGLDAKRASAVRGHLRSCAACRDKLDKTRTLVEAASSLDPLDPPASLWSRIESRLGEEESADAARSSWWWWWQSHKHAVGWGALVSGAAALALFAWMLRPKAPDDPMSQPTVAAPLELATHSQQGRELATNGLFDLCGTLDYQRAVDDLKQRARAERAHWPKEVGVAFDENVRSIDAALLLKREACREEPEDFVLVDALHAGYRREITFLQEAVLVRPPNGEEP